jgi:DMSO/TMAO reductase YedYZ molybdopterin-dependent catalytic subunit
MSSGVPSLPRISRRVLLRRGGRTLSALALFPLAACDETERTTPGTRAAGRTLRDAGHTSRDAGMDAAFGHDAGREAAAAEGSPDAGSADARAIEPDGGLPACADFLTPPVIFPQVFGGQGAVQDWRQPTLDAASWRLTVTGLVDAPLELRLAELEADTEHHVTVLATLQCVFIAWGTSIWTGVPVRELLDRARIDRSKVRRVRFVGADGFFNNLQLADLYPAAPVADAFEPLVVFRMAGERLRPELGFPARLLLCDRYGFKNIKWLSTIEATDDDSPAGQYQDEGFKDDGNVSFTVRTTTNLTAVSAGPLEVCGHARSGQGGIVAVEAAVDGGAFAPVELASLDALRAAEPALEQALQVREPQRFAWPFRGVWVPWQMTWQATAGEHRIALRAIDRSGTASQPIELHLTVT